MTQTVMMLNFGAKLLTNVTVESEKPLLDFFLYQPSGIGD